MINVKNLLRSALATAALATAFAAAGQPAQAAETRCNVNCITLIGISPDAATMSVYTTVGTDVLVEFYADRLFTVPVAVAFDYPKVTTAHTMPIRAWSSSPLLSAPAKKPLAAATGFFIKVRATDAFGNTYTGTFNRTTFQRRLTVTIDKILVELDGDIAGAGELLFDMRVNSRPGVPLLSRRAVSEPATLSGLGTKTFLAMDPRFVLQFRGQDDDCEFSTCFAPANNWGSGSNSDVEWTTASTAEIVPSYVGQSSGGFSARGTAPGVDLTFTVTGTWKYEWIQS